MFPQLEQKIAVARDTKSPKVITLLGLLSEAERAVWRGDIQRSEYLVKRAMEL